MADLPAAAITAMCECGHHWSVHRESGQTTPNAICHGYTGSETPGPLRKSCRCRGFAPWSGPTDTRTGEPVRPLMMATAAVAPNLRLCDQCCDGPLLCTCPCHGMEES